MALGSHELYELFLALAPARLAAARRGLQEAEGTSRQGALEGALMPLAVDAALLGAEGVSALASALATAFDAPDEALAEALGTLERAVVELGHGDASGARVDETALTAIAQQLRRASRLEGAEAEGSMGALAAQGAAWEAEEHAPETRASGTPMALVDLRTGSAEGRPATPARKASASPTRPVKPVGRGAEDPELSEVEYWQPQLAEDMVAAFLEECAERTEGLSIRLLELEERGHDEELIGEIFRDLHTLKGSSGFAGLRKLNRVAHVAEDLIGELRSGEREPDRALIDVLLETLECIQVILELARKDQPIDVDVSELVARLKDPHRPSAGRKKRDGDARDGDARDGDARDGDARAAEATPTVTVTRASQRPRAQATLRIDFEKVDLLLNLVGEIVLSRGQLNAGQESYVHTLREVTQFRARLAQALGKSTAARSTQLRVAGTDLSVRSWRGQEKGIADGRDEDGEDQALLDDLQRIERVLLESYGELEANLSRLGLAVGQLRDTVMKLRMVPIARLFTKYQRTVRELSNQLGKQVRVELVGADTELDKVLVERLEDPLLHLVRNAVDHGIESPERRRQMGKPEVGLVRLSASQRGGQIIVVIEDDGAGLDAERLKTKAVEKGLLTEQTAQDLPESKAFDLIFHAGFSTAQQVSDVSGRGVGMDVVRATIENLKGSVLVRSKFGEGSAIELRLPLTLAITQVLAVRVGSELVALPLDAVVSAQTLEASELETVAQSPCVRVGEELIPLIHLGAALGLTRAQTVDDDPQGHVIIVHVGTERLGLVVQHVLGRHEVVIKSLGPLLARTPCAAGATLIGDRIALVVDLLGVAQRLREEGEANLPVPAREERAAAATVARVLVAEDSDTVRDSLGRELTRAGFQVSTAVDGRAALELARATQFDAVCTDIMMPNMDGYQLIRALRALPEYRTVPIVVLSSKDARIDSLRGLDAGASAYLSKPADPGQLIRELSALLAKRGA